MFPFLLYKDWFKVTDYWDTVNCVFVLKKTKKTPLTELVIFYVTFFSGELVYFLWVSWIYLGLKILGTIILWNNYVLILQMNKYNFILYKIYLH